MTTADGRLSWQALRDAPGPALGYVRPSPGQRDVAWERDAIRAWCAKHGLSVATVVHDVARERASLAWALEQIADGAAGTLVLARLRDLAAELGELAPLLRWFAEPGRRLVALDIGVDTATESGRLAVRAVAAVVAAAPGREEPAPDPRPRHGRPAVSDLPALQLRIERMRADGMTLQAIADVLNEEAIPTVRGGRMWRPSSVQRATGYRRPAAQTRGIESPRSR
jgi:hypothetical protein